MIENLSQLKKFLQVGMPLKMVYNSFPLRLGQKTLVGTTRKINLKQANSIRFEPLAWQGSSGSWLYLDKASNFSFTEKGFNVLENGQIILTYEFI